MIADWPIDQNAVVYRLNAIDKSEIDAYEMKTEGPIVSGETRGLILSSRDLLGAIGWDLQWNHKEKKFSLTGPNGEPPFVDWIEPHIKSYAGRYLTEPFQNQLSDAAEGRGEVGPKVQAEIEIVATEKAMTSQYKVFPDGQRQHETGADFLGLVISGNQMQVKPIYVKAAWPYYLPRHFMGRFVKPESLVFDGKVYHRQKPKK